MTNGQNFKKGDIVRYIGDDNGFCYDLPLVGGAVYVVDRAYDSEVDLETPYIFMGVDVNDLELVERTDRRTAFLRKLGALLREFDARIYDNDYYRVYIDLGIHDSLNPMERIVFTDTEGEITADNIMDFDKGLTMTPKFIQPAFIKRNTPELRKKLEELGYTILFSARHGYGDGLCAWYGHVDGCQVPFKRIAGIECGDNEQLFLALVAMRDDSDKFQWFCDDKEEEYKSFFFCKYDDVELHIHNEMDGWDCEGFHKATVKELIEHFKA